MKKLLLTTILLSSLLFPNAVLAQEEVVVDEPAEETTFDSSNTINLRDCKDRCKEQYTGSDRRACKRICRDSYNSSDPDRLSGEALIDALVPSNEDLFGEDSDVGLATGDLEQGLAPRVLGIIVSFSGVLALVIFTYLGIRLVLARSNEDELTKAKRALTNTFIAAIIIAGSFAVVIGALRIFDAL